MPNLDWWNSTKIMDVLKNVINTTRKLALSLWRQKRAEDLNANSSTSVVPRKKIQMVEHTLTLIAMAINTYIHTTKFFMLKNSHLPTHPPTPEIVETTFCFTHFVSRSINFNYLILQVKVLAESIEFCDRF